MTILDYLNLITSQFRNKPKYEAMISSDVSPSIRVQDLMKEMIPIFDVDVAVGTQLDTIGRWVGLSRVIKIPISGVYFSWDSGSSLGWDFGTWQNPSEPTEITTLPDDVYRIFIKAKIAANKWDGTTEGAYQVWSEVFTDINILIQDNQNMTMSIILTGRIVDSLTLALLLDGYLPLKPEGVLVTAYYVPVDDSPGFAWDIENQYLDGWDQGAWMVESNT